MFYINKYRITPIHMKLRTCTVELNEMFDENIVNNTCNKNYNMQCYIM